MELEFISHTPNLPSTNNVRVNGRKLVVAAGVAVSVAVAVADGVAVARVYVAASCSALLTDLPACLLGSLAAWPIECASKFMWPFLVVCVEPAEANVLPEELSYHQQHQLKQQSSRVASFSVKIPVRDRLQVYFVTIFEKCVCIIFKAIAK